MVKFQPKLPLALNSAASIAVVILLTLVLITALCYGVILYVWFSAGNRISGEALVADMYAIVACAYFIGAILTGRMTSSNFLGELAVVAAIFLLLVSIFDTGWIYILPAGHFLWAIGRETKKLRQTVIGLSFLSLSVLLVAQFLNCTSLYRILHPRWRNECWQTSSETGNHPVWKDALKRKVNTPKL